MSQPTYQGKVIEAPARDGFYFDTATNWYWCHRCNNGRDCMDDCKFINSSRHDPPPLPK